MSQARILVVDDTPQNVKLLADLLSVKGYQVSTAASGEEALAKLAADKPDLVLLDVMMPGISGIEIVTRLRKDPRTSSIPVILLTAKSQEFDIDSGYAVGAADYIVKPFSPRELVARVNAVLGRSPA